MYNFLSLWGLSACFSRRIFFWVTYFKWLAYNDICEFNYSLHRITKPPPSYFNNILYLVSIGTSSYNALRVLNCFKLQVKRSAVCANDIYTYLMQISMTRRYVLNFWLVLSNRFMRYI